MRIQDKIKKILYKPQINNEDNICRICRDDINAGLCSYIITNMAGVNYAITNSMIPVIDMKNSKNSLVPKEQVGKIDGWTLYFQPVSDVVIDELRDSVYTINGHDVNRPNLTMDFLTNELAIDYWYRVFNKYLRPVATVEREINEYVANIFDIANPNKTLGILCRGTDYTRLRPLGHPMQPTKEEIDILINDYMNESDIDYIYAVSEDGEIIDYLKKRYGTRLLVNCGKKYDVNGEHYLMEQIRENNVDIYKHNLEYLKSIYCLARCDKLIAGRTSGSVVAHLLAGNDQSAFFFNHGKYGQDDVYLIQ